MIISVLISVANTTIEFYNLNGVVTYSNSIVDFFDDPDISDVCDPVKVQDSGADKYIFFRSGMFRPFFKFLFTHHFFTNQRSQWHLMEL
ncbi:MAG: hypothetical protein M3R25_01725 [Bacteroidota bacterium]|nr:hypothetical protein [Bacteroidota bacterium]